MPLSKTANLKAVCVMVLFAVATAIQGQAMPLAHSSECHILRVREAGVLGEAPAEVLEEAVVTSQLWRSRDDPASVAFGLAGYNLSVV